MLVDNVIEYTHNKFANLCAHLDSTYGWSNAIDTAPLRAVPPMALFVLLKKHLLPHAALVEAGDVDALIDAIDEPRVAEIASICQGDDKVLRYLKLFCMLVA